jgi:hypothetical protein
MIIKVLINEGNIYLQEKDTFQTINLNEYGFEYRRPIIRIENHMFNRNLVKRIRQNIKSQRSLFDRLLKVNKVFIGLESVTDKIQFDHYHDFGEIIGGTPSVVIKDSIDFKKLKIEDIFEELHSKHAFNEVKKIKENIENKTR